MVAPAGRPLVVASTLALAIACATGRSTPEDATAGPATPSLAANAAAPTPEADPPKAVTAAPIPTYTDPPSELVAAYMRDCDHRVRVEDDEYTGDTFNECDLVWFDQNCAPDPSGCWESGESCKSGCKSPCNGCQIECGATCGECRSSCAAGDENCVRHCAELRSTCRDGCMQRFEKCMGTDCNAATSECYAEFDAQKAQTCPQCEAIGECLSTAYQEQDDAPAWCKKKFPKAASECFDWCYEW